jgi:hypothetical protein
MFFIAHRGNVNGPNPETENKPETILKAIRLGYDCEIDVWMKNGQLFLGHDSPDTLIEESFLKVNQSNLWIHCKNIEALCYLKSAYHVFFHDKDLYTLTNYSFIWGNIGSYTAEGIQVMPELSNTFSWNCVGICTDYPQRYQTLYNS